VKNHPERQHKQQVVVEEEEEEELERERKAGRVK